MMHSCCQGALPSLHNRALETQPFAVHLLALTVMRPAAWMLADPVSPTNSRIGSLDTSLSGSPPTLVSVLRI